ncbi:MAG: sigma-70 family RNA polymerase sigma factor, partial [Bacteroidota bacterium]
RDLTLVEDILGYLLTCVKHRAIHLLAKSSKEKSRRAVASIRESVDWVDPSEVLLEKELRNHLDLVVAKLPERCQLVFRMSREEGMSYKEMAQELGLSTETIKSQLAKAQARLRSAITDFYKEHGQSKVVDVRLIGEVILVLGVGAYQIFSI